MIKFELNDLKLILMKKPYRHDIDPDKGDPITRLYDITGNYDVKLDTMQRDGADEHEIKAVEAERSEYRKELEELLNSGNIRLQSRKPDED